MQKINQFKTDHPEIWSIIITFVAIFITTSITLAKATNEEWITILESGLIWGILSAAGRSAIKLTIEKALATLLLRAS